jgi:SpoVK/Ycf46/Vps4 family AAA+-type ATPase
VSTIQRRTWYQVTDLGGLQELDQGIEESIKVLVLRPELRRQCWEGRRPLDEWRRAGWLKRYGAKRRGENVYRGVLQTESCKLL